MGDMFLGIHPGSPDLSDGSSTHTSPTMQNFVPPPNLKLLRQGSLHNSAKNADPRVGRAPCESGKELELLSRVGVLPDEYGVVPGVLPSLGFHERAKDWQTEMDEAFAKYYKEQKREEANRGYIQTSLANFTLDGTILRHNSELPRRPSDCSVCPLIPVGSLTASDIASFPPSDSEKSPVTPSTNPTTPTTPATSTRPSASSPRTGASCHSFLCFRRNRSSSTTSAGSGTHSPTAAAASIEKCVRSTCGHKEDNGGHERGKVECYFREEGLGAKFKRVTGMMTGSVRESLDVLREHLGGKGRNDVA